MRTLATGLLLPVDKSTAISTRQSSAAATGSAAENLWNCFSHKNVNAQRVAVGCSALLGLQVLIADFYELISGGFVKSDSGSRQFCL